MEAAEIASVIKYHEATKHSLTRYARGPRGLDWINQPDPFRRYQGAQLAPLDHLPPDEQAKEDAPLSYPSVFKLAVAPRPVTKRTLSQLLYDSLALSAWKSAGGSTWSLRVNPSSGNLHPTEGYVISGPVTGVCDSPFIAHYAPKEHALEIRAQMPPSTWKELSMDFPPGSFFVGLSSIFWREAWKYGERAFRYCNHDVGHAIGAVAIAAATLGWKTKLVDSWSSSDLRLLLGLPRDDASASDSSDVAKGHFPELENEHGDCVMLLFPSDKAVPSNWSPSTELVCQLSKLAWNGKPNSLSREHVRWEIIYRAAQAAKKPALAESSSTGFMEASREQTSRETCFRQFASSYGRATIRHVVRTRRSAVSMDGQYGMHRDAFYQILLKTMPCLGTHKQLPFSSLPWEAEVSMALFVHRVAEMKQGLYLLIRNPLHEEDYRADLRQDFVWEKPAGCPSELPLYLLARGDCRSIAERLSCHQDIAGDGCFSLGMVARFEDSLKEHGAWMYPRLFWEAGLLGQLLYLEAHAVGISATGIGCYFDDSVHQVLGIKDRKFQSLYHFTIGVPVLDTRISSLPAYPSTKSKTN
ncbi:hypothetical protein SELMODRAFT_129197 [Selaginella moellendorffii]|uniref:Nitroreductase domain-containing protein n=2 Tax=Selaginella moellendorffii TaxID=88036 RepID=D8T0I1_SELML|nr:hypothetical protein SELMODRAFT_129197 [Selaginella moellendorffii]